MNLANKVIEFHNSNTHTSKNTSNSFFKHDIMELLKNDGSGGDGMNYVTREEFIANMETIKVSLNGLQREIELTNKSTVNELKNYIHEETAKNRKETEENRKWIVGAIIVPIILSLLSSITPFIQK